ncbi:hypothetical protein [Hallella colorans]|uniref:hypothetical protein n=1 Tax=Hallella colorans TaxID=1703337 RepID=UPI0023F3FCB2|nr:hypothetical protein [Hallella colorans]
MNTIDINTNSTAGVRRTYLSPRTEIIKMATSNLVMGSPSETIEIPIDDPDATDANGKKWQGDDLDSWDEADGNDEKSWGSVW